MTHMALHPIQMHGIMLRNVFIAKYLNQLLNMPKNKNSSLMRENVLDLIPNQLPIRKVQLITKRKNGLNIKLKGLLLGQERMTLTSTTNKLKPSSPKKRLGDKLPLSPKLRTIMVTLLIGLSLISLVRSLSHTIIIIGPISLEKGLLANLTLIK